MSEIPTYTISRPSSKSLQLIFLGSWTVDNELPDLSKLLSQLDADIETILFNKENLETWDSSLLIFVNRLLAVIKDEKIRADLKGLPGGARKLLNLSERKEKAREEEYDRNNLARLVGSFTLAGFRQAGNMTIFSSSLFRDFINLFLGRAYFRPRDLFYFIQDCGANALPIVTLISILVGVILAFVGAIQLEMFGAQIYIANLVGIAMLLEMGAIITGIIMAGRTGASYAAQLGTMQVNEEIDALRTMGISPLAFLVIPRMLALILMLPLLCIYADFLGILGGGLIGVGMLNLSVTEYYIQTLEAIELGQFWEGIFKSLVYAFLVGYAGCFYGMKSGRSAAAVGQAATYAVVAAIILIVIADAVMVVIFNIF